MTTTKGSWLKNASPEERKRVASSGGRSVSQDRAHMAEIGRRGGTTTSKDRAHMAAISAIAVSARAKKPVNQVK